MRRFTGNKTAGILFQNNAKKFLQPNLLNKQDIEHNNNIDKTNYHNYSQNSNSSNLNSFVTPDLDQASNLLIALQGIQLVTSRSNVILIAVGGIVSRFVNFFSYKKITNGI